MSHGEVLIKVLAPFSNASDLLARVLANKAEELLVCESLGVGARRVVFLHHDFESIPVGGLGPVGHTFPKVCDVQWHIFERPLLPVIEVVYGAAREMLFKVF